MGVAQVSVLQHVALVLFLLFILNKLDLCQPFVYFISFIYLYKVNQRCSVRVRRRIQSEERKHASQQRLFQDRESIRWLNHVVEKVWPVCLEQIASQQLLLPIVSWFLDRFKPWTAKKAVVQHLYLGRNPPMFTEIQALRKSNDGYHLLLELGMNFLAADDMNAVLAVKLRRRLGFGMWSKVHVTRMRIEGKVLVGVKFIQHWPFLGRVRVCFIEPPYIQMTIKPIFYHGIGVADLPGIAGWLDKTLDAAFEQTLVEPNMLVIDVEKLTAGGESWFTVDVKCPVAFAKLEIVEALQIQPPDTNGLADPYVKGYLGSYRFQTKVHKKTLAPKWLEEFKIPIPSWEACNNMVIEVRDKDPISDKKLGECSVNIRDLRGGQRHDKWLTLKNTTTGRLRLAISIIEVDAQKNSNQQSSVDDEAAETVSTGSSPRDEEGTSDILEVDEELFTIEFKAKHAEGQLSSESTFHHDGNEVSNSPENTYVYGNSRHECYARPMVSSDPIDPKRSHGTIRRSLQKLGVHHKSPKAHSIGHHISWNEKQLESPMKGGIKHTAEDMVNSTHNPKIVLNRNVNKFGEDYRSESHDLKAPEELE